MRGALANQRASPASNGGAGDRAIETGTGKLGENWKRRDLPRLFLFVLPRILAWNSSAISVPHAVAGLVGVCLSGPCFDRAVRPAWIMGW